MPKTIMITGASSGLGRAVATTALARGHRVIGTLRKEEDRRCFEALAPGRAVGRLLDVTDTAAIAPLIEELDRTLGSLDVLVNNAGYGLQGVIEELEPQALRHQFEVNVISPMMLIQAVLPGMRRRRRGHIVNIASMGSMVTFPGLGAYHGSKFALLGMSDALAQEVAPLGIHVTAVLPGMYRSDWAGRSLVKAERRLPDYDDVLTAKGELVWGDVSAFGRVMVDALELPDPPAHLLVGPTALTLVRQRLEAWQAEIDRWESLSQADGQG